MSIKNKIRKILFNLEQAGITDKEFKVEATRLVILLDILKQIADKYTGEKNLESELENTDITFPPHEFMIVGVGRTSFFEMLYGEISYHRKILYKPFHIRIVSTFEKIHEFMQPATKQIIESFRKEIYEYWKQIDEKYFRKHTLKTFEDAAQAFVKIIGDAEKLTIPFELPSTDKNKIEIILKTFPESDLANLVSWYSKWYDDLKRVEELLRINIPEKVSNALARYPATDIESKYQTLIRILQKKVLNDAKAQLEKILLFKDKLPNPVVLKCAVDNISEEKQRKHGELVLKMYSKIFIDTIDNIYLLQEKIDKLQQELVKKQK